MKLNDDVMEQYRAVLAGLPKSVTVRNQVKRIVGLNGNIPVECTVGWDDSCGNGHNTFSVSQVDTVAKYRGGDPVGSYQREVVPSWFKYNQEFHRAERWHLLGPTGPMHYLENVIYLAGDRDHWGLRKGEERQIRNGKTGELAWTMESSQPKYHDGPTCPDEVVTLKWKPWMRVGEGKKRELDAARSTACWPDATDEQLSAEPNELAIALINRLPALMAEFHEAVIKMGFQY